jgi:hypothetical protein
MLLRACLFSTLALLWLGCARARMIEERPASAGPRSGEPAPREPADLGAAPSSRTEPPDGGAPPDEARTVDSADAGGLAQTSPDLEVAPDLESPLDLAAPPDQAPDLVGAPLAAGLCDLEHPCPPGNACTECWDHILRCVCPL